MIILLLIIILILFLTGLLTLVRFLSDFISSFYGAPYVSLPIQVGKQMLTLAKATSSDTVVDLGCGDGRLLRLAIEEFNVQQAIGYEISPWPYLKAKLTNRHFKIRIIIKKEDLFDADLSKTTVVILYLTTNLLEQLVTKLQRELPDGARIVSARYPLPNWTPIEKDRQTQFPIWLYRIER